MFIFAQSCVNLVLEFISPESASECFKLTEEFRRLPMNHKAKGKNLAVSVLTWKNFKFFKYLLFESIDDKVTLYQVKKMIVHCIDAAVEEISKVSHAE